MREFSSYGPVDPRKHFSVARVELVEQCIQQLVGDPDEGGRFFTMWGSRQTGKTWIMRRARDEIRARYGDRFTVTVLTLQGLMKTSEPEEVFFRNIPGCIEEGLGVTIPPLSSFDDWRHLFRKKGGLFDRSAILLIDEFDSLAPQVIDSLVAIFRKMYLTREAYHLHGLALIGVRAALGMDSKRGSPFNVQRTLHVPNLTQAEVREMFAQYQTEGGQPIEPAVVDGVYEATRGQPGLVSWFGELLTQKYNRDRGGLITLKEWKRTYGAACRVEFNNTVLNLIKKAQEEYRGQVAELFSRPDVTFSVDQPWCNFLYLNGIIDYEDTEGPNGEILQVCRFASPFIQTRLFNALSPDLGRGVPVVDVMDEMADVYLPAGLGMPALLRRYQDYLTRLRQAGIDPWQDQPRRVDLHITEAAGHFHLYAWLQEVLRRRATVSPEFPTGNGKVDLIINCKGQISLIEVKSLRQQRDLPDHREQAAAYAHQKGLTSATLAVFVPIHDEAALQKLSGEADIGGVRVTTMAFG